VCEARIVDILRKQAEEDAESRRICEFGPAGGNSKAKAEQHIEWKAANYIDSLEAENAKLKRRIAELEG